MLVNAVMCDSDTIIWFFSCFKITQYIQDAVIRRLKLLRHGVFVSVCNLVDYSVSEVSKLRHALEMIIRGGDFALCVFPNLLKSLNISMMIYAA